MTMAGDESDDLSIRLEWPVDPLTTPPASFEREGGTDRLAAQIEALDSAADGSAAPSDVVETLRKMSEGLLRAIDENMTAMDERIAGVRTALMAMLASRQAEEQRTFRNEREALLARVEEVVAASRTQSDVFADRVASELQSLRRRIPLKGHNAATLDDESMEELVARVADEVEIRIAAALKPKPKRRA